jgi:flagellar biogenesis protein FliO
MPLVDIGQILTVLGFLGVLFAAQYVLRRNRAGLRARLAPKGRLQHLETLGLGTGERLLLLSVDGRECLLHSGRSGSSLVLLEKTTEAEPCVAP